jgi:hypothetical protein
VGREVPDTGERDEESVMQMRMEERLAGLDLRATGYRNEAILKIDTLKERIEELEHNAKDERNAAIHESAILQERVFHLENAVASLTLCTPPPEPRCPPETAWDIASVLQRIVLLEKQHVELPKEHHISDVLRVIKKLNEQVYVLEHMQKSIAELDERVSREQDLLNANRRIEALEQATNSPSLHGCKLWADCTALLQRTAALERLTCDKGNENANGIASATARVAANEARILALEERLQTVWIAPINALKERCDALEKIANSDDLATSFVKDAWRKDINERIAKIELPMTKESDASIKDHNENMCERFNDIEEKIDELQNTVISVRVLVGKRFESGVA